MTDPTPQPTPAGNLVERAADLFLDDILCDADCHATYPAIHDAARAVVALVLDEAAHIAQDMDFGEGTNPWAWPERIAEAIRDRMPKEKPYE